MNIVDVSIILITAAAAVAGMRAGGIRQGAFSLQIAAGFLFATMFAGHIMGMVSNPALRSFVIVALIIVMLALFANFGLILGRILHAKLPPKGNWQPGNTIVGGLCGAATAMLFVWLIGPMLGHSPIKPVASQIRGSRVLIAFDQALPVRPVSINEVANLLQPFHLPKIFIGGEPALYFPERPLEEVDISTAIDHASPSVIKVSGRACGLTSTGSGFFVKPGLIMTNAHVIAGISKPVVESDGKPHIAKVVWFDPDMDVALLKLTVKEGRPLRLATDILPRGTAGAIIGYPKGQQQASSEAVILDSFDAMGFDIYDKQKTSRAVYALNAQIVPGNSGGPVINSKAEVIGLVIGHSLDNADIGYALTMEQFIPSIEAAANQETPAVATGACLAS